VLVWFRESSEIQRFERIFGLHSKCLVKELPPLSNFIHKAKKTFCRARKSLGTSLAIQCYAVLLSSGFRVITTGDKGKLFNYSFFSFLYLLSSYSARVYAPCDWTFRQMTGSCKQLLSFSRCFHTRARDAPYLEAASFAVSFKVTYTSDIPGQVNVDSDSWAPVL